MRKMGLDDFFVSGGTVEELLTFATRELRVAKPVASDEPWPEIIPFDDVGRPPFPVGTLPQWLQNFVVGLARALQVPGDLPAIMSLAVLATATAKRLEVHVRDGWDEPMNIFTIGCLPPGERKSAVFRAVTAPIETFERDEAARLAPMIAEAESRQRVLEQARNTAEKQAANVPLDEQESAIERATQIARELAEHVVPKPPRLLAEDSSPERLGTILKEQGGRIGVFSAEGGEIFDILAGRYSTSANIGVYLRGHAGDDLRVDRVNRPAEHVERPALTLAVVVQPEVIAGLASKPGFRGRGLLGRLLFSLPLSLIGSRDTNPPPLARAVRDDYERHMRTLLQLPAGTDQDGRRKPHRLTLSGDATTALDQFMIDLEPQLGPGGRYEGMTDWAGKLAGHVARIAGLLHAARSAPSSGTPWETPISGADMRAAIDIGEYFAEHARIAFGQMGSDPALAGAKHLLAWIERTEVASFSKRSAHQANRGRFQKATEVDAPLHVLVERGYIRPVEPVEQPRRGQAPSPQFAVNPGLQVAQLTRHLHEHADLSREIHEDREETASETGAPRSAPKLVVVPSVEPPPAAENAETSVILVDDDDHFDTVLPVLRSADHLALDTETTGLDPFRDRLRTVQLATEDTVYVIDADTVLLEPLNDVLATIPRIIAHNAAFDFRFLAAAGISMPAGERVFDTMVAARLLEANANKKTKGHFGLDQVVERYLDQTVTKIMQTADWSSELSTAHLEYAAKDAAVLLPLAAALEQEICAAGLTYSFDIEMQALPALVWLEQSGAPFDPVSWRQRAEADERKQQRLLIELRAEAGSDVNWNSPPQVKAFFASRGRQLASTTEADIAALAETDVVAALLLQYRKAAKRASTYGVDYLKHVSPVTGRIHASYHQLGAQSGRMACTGPNLQNVPKLDEFRGCFKAPSGRVLIRADFSQVELRIAAEIADDEMMIRAFVNGEDLHVATARSVLGHDPTKDERQMAKALAFGLVYGMSAATLRDYALQNYGISLTPERAKELRRRFFTTYQGLRRWQNRHGIRPIDTRTVSGRRRLGVSRFTEQLNSPVQGTGADVLKLALARLVKHRSDVPSAALVVVVHDEIVIEVDEDEAQAAVQWLEGHMKAAGAELLTRVPIEVETCVATTWAGN